MARRVHGDERQPNTREARLVPGYLSREEAFFIKHGGVTTSGSAADNYGAYVRVGVVVRAKLNCILKTRHTEYQVLVHHNSSYFEWYSKALCSRTEETRESRRGLVNAAAAAAVAG